MEEVHDEVVELGDVGWDKVFVLQLVVDVASLPWTCSLQKAGACGLKGGLVLLKAHDLLNFIHMLLVLNRT